MSQRKDFDWLNKDSKLFLSRGYLEEGETAEQRIKNISKTAQKYLEQMWYKNNKYKFWKKKPELIRNFSEKFEYCMARGWFSLSTPVWSNYGKKRGAPVSCFGSRTELDSCESIIYTNAEIATMTQKGGGTSIYIGDLRPRGSKISSGGVSDGPISFLGLFESSANIMKQGCYAFDTEVLTEKGWMLFEDIINRSEIKVAQVHDDDSIDFVTPDNYFKYEVDEELILFKDSKNIDLLVTQNHNMRYKRLDRVNTKKDKDGKYISNEKFLNPKVFMKQAKDMPLYRNIILNNSGFAKATSNNCLTHKERFLIALQADGHINKLTNKLDFHFSKQRKIDRLINILSNLEGYSYIKRDSKSDNTTYIIVTPPEGIQHTKQFDWVNLNTISKEWCLDFVLELLEWDGSKNANNPINGKYSSVLEYNVDIAQCVASMCGYKTRKTTVARDESRHCIYNLQLSKGEHFGVEKLKPELLPYKGFVYCVEVPTHNILVRRNGHVTVCGNSTRRGSLAAYLPIEHPDIMEFLDIRMEGCPLQNILSGVTVGNEWFEEMKAGDKGKRKVWAKLMKARAFAGVPYILFRDNANKNKPQVYKDKNMEIVASNLCVTGDQRVVSDRGLLTVKELYEQGGSLKLFDNDKIVNASPMQLIEKDADVFKITLENGLEHSITGYHKVSTKNGNVACSDLKVGDMVKVQTKSMYGDSSGYFPEYEDYYISFNSYSNGVGSKQEIYDALKNLTLEQKIFLASRGELINDDGCSKIVSIEHIGKEDVYCTTVDSQEHLWICNGFITSNCNEIMLPSSENESFVCVLSSINLLYYDEWKDTDAPEILLAFLDTVNEEFVIKTNNMPFMKRANRFAKRHRALGLGVLGWHSYLQKNMIPFGSFVAMGKTNEIFSKINDKTLNMTKQLASWFGEPELLKGYGERNTTRCALAPTKSSSFILGQVSQSIEPYHSNYFVDDKAKAQVVFKNPYLKEVLKKYDKDDQEVWDSIKDANGSVQHLKFLTDEEREVFKTFGEISQMDIIKQAGIRQKYIDQGQSLNLMIHPKCSAKDENQLYIASHEEGLKGLYYRKSFNAASEFRRELVSCSTCEG